MIFWEKWTMMAVSSDSWRYSMILFVLSISFYSSKLFLATENGSTITTLEFPVIKSFIQTNICLGCAQQDPRKGHPISSYSKTLLSTLWRSKFLRRAWLWVTNSVTSLWSPFSCGNYFFLLLHTFMIFGDLIFLRDECLILHNSDYFSCVHGNLGWSKQLCCCCHFKTIRNFLASCFSLLLLLICKWKKFLWSCKVVGRETVGPSFC